MSRLEEPVNRREPSRALIAIMLASAMLASYGCGADRRADRLYREASELVEKGDTAAAVPKLEEILRDYPDSEAASKARREVVLYRGLSEAVAAYPVRRARDLMVQAARALERFRAARGTPPDSLDALVPSYLAAAPTDPWGKPLEYVRTAKGYRLACLGSDGAPGGEGDAGDLVVVDGSFAKAPR
jgi:hypothetical protein